jgi:hypothetical protein
MYALITQMANDRSAELRRDASARRLGRLARRRRAAAREADGSTEEVTVRHLDPSTDHAALVRLAERDSAAVLSGEVIGAEVNGSLVAAISLRSNRVIADPFTQTASVQSLLKVRAAQVA